MEIVVPGSAANLGSGFDTLAVALQIYLRVRIVDIREDAGAALHVVRSTPAVRGQNAVERAFNALARLHAAGATIGAAHRHAGPVPSVFVEVDSDIPMAAGLGSSAAAAVAGLRVFEHVTAPLTENELLAAATTLEGHADNAAAALFGGLTSVVDDRYAIRWHWPEDLKLVVATPAIGLATSKARAALPATLSRTDAVFNLQRVLAFVHALQTGRYDRLRDGVGDRWHQPARSGIVPQLDEVLAIDDPEVLCAFLSGAGPSVAVLARRDFTRIERLLAGIYERAGSAVTVRTLAVHQPTAVLAGALASARGGTV